jgi:uncharacterized BrkB/YihY/UPF0761 family membrane protein
LIWVYYSSQIILMGAEVTHAFAKHKGSIKKREQSDRSFPDHPGGVRADKPVDL